MIKNAPHIDFSKIKHLLTDSRKLRDAESTLFFCLPGNGRHGSDFIPELYDKGVRYFVVPTDYHSKLKATFIPCSYPKKLLQQVARYHRESYKGKVIAVTGSNGKTVVKEWLFQLLSKQQYTYRSPKSYNSQIGVPLSLWEIPLKSHIAIIEAGISQVGEMQKLANIIAPEIGIFTNIGSAHQENFDSIEQKLDEKLLLFENCESIIYRSDNQIVADFIRAHFSDKSCIAWSLEDSQASYFIKKENKGISLYQMGQFTAFYPFPFQDDASVENIGHCLVTALELGIDAAKIDLSTLEAVAMRLEQKRGINHCTLINDAYNSDILSLGIALDSLDQLSESKQARKSIVLSDIEQSGMSPEELYREVAAMLSNKCLDRFIGVGKEIKQLANFFPLKNSTFYQDTEELLKNFDAASFINEVILFKGARSFQFERIIRLLEERRHQTIMEIDLNALRENFNYFRGLLKPKTKIMGMVKAFGYGSGAVEIARTLEQQGCNYLAVAVADEGVDLRNNGITLPIVVMNPERNSFEVMISHQLEPAVYSFSELNAFRLVADNEKQTAYPIHIKFDTGMHRLGFSAKDLDQLIETLKNQEILKAASVFSHLAAADEKQWDHFSMRQIREFENIAATLEKKLNYSLTKHILNSAGSERFTQHQNDMVRLGIGMYGISHTGQNMQHIATLKTSISQIHTIPASETVGYGRKGKVKQESRIATLPIGYADGIRRSLGNGTGYVLINGQKAPFIGNICMDLSMIDVTLLDAREGDEVILLGEEIPATKLAELTGTIPYEVLTSISQRVKRVYVE